MDFIDSYILEHWSEETSCRGCGGPIRVGQTTVIMADYVRGIERTYDYHRGCFKEVA